MADEILLSFKSDLGALQKEIDAVKAKMATLEASAAKTGAAVGSGFTKAKTGLAEAANAAGRFDSANAGLSRSIAQVSRELPSLQIGFQTFVLAISNNLPMVVDEIQRTTASIKALKAEGKAAPSVIGAIGSALLSWQTALSVGITLFTVFSGKIVEFVSDLFGLNKEVKETIDRIEEFKASNQKTSEEIALMSKRMGAFNVNAKEYGEIIQGLSKKELQTMRTSLLANITAEQKHIEELQNSKENIYQNQLQIDLINNTIANYTAALNVTTEAIDKNVKKEKEAKAVREKNIELMKALGIENSNVSKSVEEQAEFYVKLANEIEIARRNNDSQIKTAIEGNKELVTDYEKTYAALQKTIKDSADKQKEINKELKADEEELMRIRMSAIESSATLSLTTMTIDRNFRNAEVQEQLLSLEKKRDAELESASLTAEGKKAIEEKYTKERREILKKQWEADKRAAIATAIINGSVAVIKNLGNPLLAAATAIAVAAEIAIIEAQPTPRFHSGEIDIKPRRKNKKGEFDAVLIEGESVIAPTPTKRYKRELEAINTLKFDDFVYVKHILPALEAQKKQFQKEIDRSFASNVANSMMVNFADGNIVEMLKRLNQNGNKNNGELIKAFKTMKKNWQYV